MNYFIPPQQDKEDISVRLPAELLKEVDASAARSDISRNEFINQCIVFAMRHLKENTDSVEK